MTALVTRSLAGSAHNVVGTGGSPVAFGETTGAYGVLGFVLLLSMIQCRRCSANVDLLGEDTVGDLDIDEPPTCEPPRQSSPLVSVSFHHQL